eukprot:4269381-Pleurochrysis_carterae.AAC.1
MQVTSGQCAAHPASLSMDGTVTSARPCASAEPATCGTRVGERNRDSIEASACACESDEEKAREREI